MIVSSISRLTLRPTSISYGQNCQISIYRKYEKFLEKKYPKIYRVHRLVVDGCRDCVMDVRTLYRLNKDLKYGKRGLSEMNTKELMCLLQCPPELMRILVILVLLQFPIIGEGLIISAIFFPRFVLTRHFWTSHQKEEFWQKTYDYTFRPRIKRLQEFTEKENFSLESPVKLVDLSVPHLLTLCRLHRSWPLYGCKGLEQRASVMKQLDHVILEDLEEMDETELRNQMFLRRLDFHLKSEEEMKDSIRNWVKNSKKLGSNPGALLHLPAILAQREE
ncbi:unnamed protein product [Bursaphelenchus xylophilus]|uniref:(pine wood nematode) hypothetical protein n=1 Tax=Bursaphelenchus xylophilus TaxID=6326 RepID=A0A1I7RL23_BURXY|nr:unnamed protein product [Bursaphelenchus xylophilus]CAG9083556.1 unnamed protein product [Bursaphelenchus xylophilus]